MIMPTPPAAGRLTKPTNRITPSTKPDHISYSQIKSYCMCSLKWYFSRHFESESVSSALVFGKSWHAAVEYYYQQHMQGVTADVTQLRKVFQAEYAKEVKPITYRKTESADILFEKAQQMLKVFCDNVIPGKVVALEEEIRCTLQQDMPELLGYIDLIEICRNDRGEDELVLVDHKTAARKPDAPDYNQLLLYAIAAHKLNLVKQYNLPLRLRFDYITKTKEPSYLQFRFEPDHDKAKRLLATMRSCCHGMREGIIFPNPGWQCSGCGYKKLCGKWPALSVSMPS